MNRSTAQEKDAGPWYREPWPWIVMAGPAIVVVAGIATAVIAYRGADGLVADDYYKRGLAINREITRSATAAKLGLRANLSYDAAAGRVRVAVPDEAKAGELLILRFTHPTRMGEDRQITLTRAPDGSYGGATEPLPTTRWRVVLETAQWRLEGDWRDLAQPIDLQPAG